MVNSKKMSKSSIAVIVLAIMLALSMILGVTGAWFTGSNETGIQGDTLTFGELGSIQLGGGTLSHKDAKGVAVVGRSVMPGDEITLIDATITYTATEGQEQNVWYVLVKDGKYYNDVAMSTEATEAANLATGVTLTVDAGEVLYMGIPVTTENAAEFKNDAQTQTITITDSTFEFRMIQGTNLDKTSAFTALTENWATVKTA